MYTRTQVQNGYVVPSHKLTQQPQTTAFLKGIAKAMSENKLSMDTLAKTPITKRDLLGDVTVVPL